MAKPQPARSKIGDEFEVMVLGELPVSASNEGEERTEPSVRDRYLQKVLAPCRSARAAVNDWTDLDRGHGSHEGKHGVWLTITEPALHEVLQRLLKLNHERYAEEVKQGRYGKKGRRAKKKETGQAYRK